MKKRIAKIIGDSGVITDEDAIKKIIFNIDDWQINNGGVIELREGLKDTPKRYLKFLEEFTTPPEFNFTTFTNEGNDEMIIVQDISFFSLCEHHLAPFFGTAAIAYIPTNKIVGLSKLPRVVDLFSRRLQNQERITKQIAEYLMTQLNPKGVSVVMKARHMCMEMRGIQKVGCNTTTSEMTGVFKTDINCRQEFLKLIGK